MFGFFVGTLCLFGLVGMARRAHWHAHGRYAYAGCGGHHGMYGGRWRGRHGRGEGRRGDAPFGEGVARAAGEVLKRRLDIDEEQEPIVDHALVDLRKTLKTLRDELSETRGAVSAAFAGETVDDAALAGAFARQDDALQRARREVVSAMKQVHAVLDADQRKRAAEWLASGEGGW